MQSSKENQRKIRPPSLVIMQRYREKQYNEKDQRSLQESQNTKGIFHAKIDTIKDRNDMDLIEAEDIKKW